MVTAESSEFNIWVQTRTFIFRSYGPVGLTA
jgi:hypothetical protein